MVKSDLKLGIHFSDILQEVLTLIVEMAELKFVLVEILIDLTH
jgi:hypothetical protein